MFCEKGKCWKQEIRVDTPAQAGNSFYNFVEVAYSRPGYVTHVVNLVLIYHFFVVLEGETSF